MGPGYLLLIPCVIVFIFFFLLFVMEIFTELNYTFHRYTPPPLPMYYRHCPPPSPQYYLRLEYLESLPEEDEVHTPNKIYTHLKN